MSRRAPREFSKTDGEAVEVRRVVRGRATKGTQLRLKIELNKGRHGIPIEKLAKVAEEAEKFLGMFAADMNFGETQWIAENFHNGSVEYDVSCVGVASDMALRIGQRALAQLVDPKTTPDDLSFGIRRETFLQFARMASHVDADDAVGIGVYNGKPKPKMHALSKQRYLEIEKQVNQTVVQYGGVQGVITTLFKESNILWIRELSTGERISCKFPVHYYNKIWKLLKAKDAIVNVEGWITHKNGVIDHLKIETIDESPEYLEGDLEKFFGADPNFTGGRSAGEHLDDIRGETAEDYLTHLTNDE